MLPPGAALLVNTGAATLALAPISFTIAVRAAVDSADVVPPPMPALILVFRYVRLLAARIEPLLPVPSGKKLTSGVLDAAWQPAQLAA